MRAYKHIQFAEGIKCTLSEFKKDFAPHLKRLSDSEIKEAHKAATKGNVKLSNKPTESKKADTEKG